MNKTNYFSRMSLFLFLIGSPFCQAAVIALNFEQFPLIGTGAQAQKLVDKLARPGTIAKHNLRALQNKNIISGIFGTYAGFLGISDWNGRMTFPRMQNSDTIYLIVTTKMSPILMLANTIHHWEFEEGTPVAFYKAEQSFDQETQQTFWKVSPEPLPKDNIIPLASVLIFARPKDIVVPLGDSIATKSPHLLLPKIYVKRSINRTSNALYVININPFFANLQTTGKAEKKDLLLLIQP